MSNVKAHRPTFIDLQLELEKVVESLKFTATAAEHAIQNNLKNLQYAYDKAIDDLDIAERNYYSCVDNESKDQDCDDAQATYYAAQRRVDEVKTKLKEFERQIDEYEGVARLAWQLVDHELPKCKSELAHRERIMERLTSLGMPDTSRENASQSGATHTGQSPTVLKNIHNEDKWIDRGIISVSVEDLPNPEGISGDADFKKVSSEDMQKGLLQLQEIQTAIKTGSGVDGDYWTQVDNSKGLEYEHGYRRIYDAFFGEGAIKLTKVGNSYDITNGRHRIWLAKRMGLKTLPARVTEKADG